jgi:hypothetical protein
MVWLNRSPIPVGMTEGSFLVDEGGGGGGKSEPSGVAGLFFCFSYTSTCKLKVLGYPEALYEDIVLHFFVFFVNLQLT